MLTTTSIFIVITVSMDSQKGSPDKAKEEKWLKYFDVSKQLRVSFVVYTDFESLLQRQYGCQLDPSKSSTTKLARHVPSGFTYKIAGITQETTEKYVPFRGPDAMNVSIGHMIKLEERIIDVLHNPKPMNLTGEELNVLRTSTHCCICNQEFEDAETIVRDHCHVKGIV